MYLLDTDTITHLYRGNPQVIKRLQEIPDPAIAITVITKIEALRGRFDHVLKAATGTELLRAEQLLLRTEELLAQLQVVYLDAVAAEQFDKLRQVSAYRKIGRADLLIASITLTHRAVLVTRNLKHFRQIPNLWLENWVD